jgi:hypothetical protein
VVGETMRMQRKCEHSPGRTVRGGGERELSMRERDGCEDREQVQNAEQSLLQALGICGTGASAARSRCRQS